MKETIKRAIVNLDCLLFRIILPAVGLLALGFVCGVRLPAGIVTFGAYAFSTVTILVSIGRLAVIRKG